MGRCYRAYAGHSLHRACCRSIGQHVDNFFTAITMKFYSVRLRTQRWMSHVVSTTHRCGYCHHYEPRSVFWPRHNRDSRQTLQVVVFMVALWNRADHYIFILSFVLSSFCLSFFLISAAADWMSAILYTWCGLSANLRCSLKTQDAKKSPNIAIWPPSHKFVGL